MRFLNDSQRKAAFARLNSFSFSNRFVRPDYLKGNRRYVSVEVSVPKFEKAWENNPQNHFVKEEVATPERFEGVENFIKRGESIDMPEVFAEPSLDSVKVADGRHRIAAMRDLGYKRMTIVVPKFQEDYFIERFGVN